MKLKDFYVAYAICVDEVRTVFDYRQGQVVGSKLISCGNKFKIYKSANQGLYTKIGKYYRHAVSGVTLDELKGAYGNGKIGVPDYAVQTVAEFFAQQIKGNESMLEQEISMDKLEVIEEMINKTNGYNKDEQFAKIQKELGMEQDLSL